MYALWGLVDDEVYALFAANIAVSGLGGTDEWSVNLQWLGFYLVLAMVAWALRQLVGLASRRRPARPLLLLGVVLEGTWTFASALALLSGLGRVVDWVTSRAVWQGLSSAWYAILDALPDLRLPFDLTLPEALHALAEWVTLTLVPGVWAAVLLPLMWLALTAVVFGWREVDARTVAAGTLAEVAHERVSDPLAYGSVAFSAAPGRLAGHRRPPDQVPPGPARLPAAVGHRTGVPGGLPGRRHGGRDGPEPGRL